MSALLKIDMYHAVCDAAALKKSVGWVPQVIVGADRPAAVPVAAGGALKNIALFLASPFIGLAYIMAMPFVAGGMLAWFAAKALAAKAARLPRSVKQFGLTLAAPFLGLGFIIALPLVGVTALGYFALKSAVKA